MTGLASRIVVLALVVALPACGVADEASGRSKVNLPVSSSMAPAESAQALAVLEQVNAVRTARGLIPFAFDWRASDAAYDHAVDMRSRGYYAHVNPEGEGPCARLRRAGLTPFGCGAENIARGEETAEEVVAVWLASADHKVNLLNPHATHVGVGVSMGGDGPWWVMDLLIPNLDREDLPPRPVKKD